VHYFFISNVKISFSLIANYLSLDCKMSYYSYYGSSCQKAIPYSQYQYQGYCGNGQRGCPPSFIIKPSGCGCVEECTCRRGSQRLRKGGCGCVGECSCDDYSFKGCKYTRPRGFVKEFNYCSSCQNRGNMAWVGGCDYTLTASSIGGCCDKDIECGTLW